MNAPSSRDARIAGTMSGLPDATVEWPSRDRMARLAGVLYLSLALLAPFSALYVPSRVFVLGDGAASMARILEHAALFRAGIAVDALVFLIEIVLTVLLYRLLEPVDRTLSAMAACARLAMTVLQGANVGISLATLRLSASGQPALVQVSLLAHADFMLVWQAFFGLHCVLLGVLVYRSGVFPRVLGALLLLAAAGYLSDSFGRFVSPAYGERFGWVVVPAALVGELSFTCWLLFKGTRAGVALGTEFTSSLSTPGSVGTGHAGTRART